MKRALTSFCGILLIACLIYTTNNSGTTINVEGSSSGTETFFEGSILSLNIFFLLIFLMSILAIIKEEDSNEKDKTLL